VPKAFRILVSLAAALAPVGTVTAQDERVEMQSFPANGRQLGGFVLPIVPLASDCTISGGRVFAWKAGDTQRLQIDRDVRISLGAYQFHADRALVWINRLPTADGAVNQIALYFDEVREPTARAGFGASGRDLLVTASARGEVVLRTAITERRMPDERSLLLRGERRLAEYQRRLAGQLAARTARLEVRPEVDSLATPAPRTLTPGDPIEPPPAAAAVEVGVDSVSVPVSRRERIPVVDPAATVSFFAREITVSEETDTVLLEGTVNLEWISDGIDGIGGAGGLERLEMRAERGVIFVAPDSMRNMRERRKDIAAADLVGVYLEGNVIATDGRYTLRGARIYYDFATRKATVVDAVLRTASRNARFPIVFARAAEMRQVAADTFEADRAEVSTSEFFVPHLSIGVERVTVTQPTGDDEGTWVKADAISLRAGGRPLLNLGGYEGEATRMPFRGVSVGFQDEIGLGVETDWDLFQLMGLAPPEGLEGELSVDGFFARGPGLGLDFDLGGPLGDGKVDLYGLYDFGGTDRTSAGENVEVDAGLRGILDGEWQESLGGGWNLQAQGTYISDPTFVSAWREDDFNQRREYETGAYLSNASANTLTSLQFKGTLNDFLANSYLLASRGYAVEKLPELQYRRAGDDLWGLLSWTQTWSTSLMKMQLNDRTPAEMGIPSYAFWGVPQDVNLQEAYELAGYDSDLIGRLHSRQELAVPFSGPGWSLVPFANLQAEGYFGDNFIAYSPDAENFQFLGGGGVRTSARIVRTMDSVRSRLFDINRLRHVLEPYANLWAGYNSNENGSRPVYDQQIEGASAATVGQVGLRQQFQTQRGGPGAWESVDVLTVDAGVVLSGSDDDFQASDLPNGQFDQLKYAQSPMPSYYSWRPELSQWGSNVYGSSQWQVSDTFTLNGTGMLLLDDRQYITNGDGFFDNLARGSVGAEMRHSPDLTTYVEYRYIAPTLSELLQLGATYKIGKKYTVTVSPQIDLLAGDIRSITGGLVRRFPDFDLNLFGGYDIVSDQTSVSLSMRIPANASPPLPAFGLPRETP
jgi:hypothetical protein